MAPTLRARRRLEAIGKSRKGVAAFGVVAYEGETASQPNKRPKPVAPRTGVGWYVATQDQAKAKALSNRQHYDVKAKEKLELNPSLIDSQLRNGAILLATYRSRANPRWRENTPDSAAAFGKSYSQFLKRWTTLTFLPTAARPDTAHTKCWRQLLPYHPPADLRDVSGQPGCCRRGKAELRIALCVCGRGQHTRLSGRKRGTGMYSNL